MTSYSTTDMAEPPAYLSDEDVKEIARDIPHDRFQDICLQLDCYIEQPETVEDENAYFYGASVDMLDRWRKKHPEYATKETIVRLLSAFSEKPQVEVDETHAGEDDKEEIPKAQFALMKAKESEAYEDLVISWGGRRIYKNLILLSCSFFFIFTAFHALSVLQSSINCDAGLGLASLSTVYATLILSAMFIPSLIIRHLGLKWTLVFSMVCYVLYTVANFYPSWVTLIPASVILGLAAAPLWTAKSTYLTTIAGSYAKLSGDSVPSVVSRFWGIYFCIYQSSEIFGNLISSLVFRQELSINRTTDQMIKEYQCGVQDCYTETGDKNSTSYCDPPERRLTYTLLGIYFASGVLATLLIVFLVDNLRASRKIQDQRTFTLFMATARLMKDYRLVLIIPLTIYTGLAQAFVSGDFTKSYVTCTLGVGWVGYIMICHGITGALFSFVYGRLVKYTGQVPIFCFGGLLNACLIATFFLWEPQTSKLPVFFAVSALWGVGDAVWRTQLNALYGIIFRDEQEPAFSNLRLWQSVGFTVAFAYSNFLCVWVKLIILACVLGVAMLGYGMVAITLRRQEKES